MWTIHKARDIPREPTPRHPVAREVIEFRRFGPFLPYTLLFGLPKDIPSTFPLWTNLLKRGLRPLAFFGETLGEALAPALAVLESLTLTTPEDRAGILVFAPEGQGSRLYGWKRDILHHGSQNGGTPPNVWTWEALRQELEARRNRGYRGPMHGVVVLYDLGRRMKEPTWPWARLIQDLVKEGPQVALWPMVVDTYKHLAVWHPQALGPVVLRGARGPLPSVLLRLFRDRGCSRAAHLTQLAEDEALLLRRQGCIPYLVPRYSLRNWSRVFMPPRPEPVVTTTPTPLHAPGLPR